LKAAGLRARHPAVAWPTAEVPMSDSPTPPWETDELKAIIDEELTSLPDKLRAAIVLCLIEGRTNSEAAAILGIPAGTVDSRLNAARKKLGAKLARRGVAVSVGTTLDQMLGGPLAAADGARINELVSHIVPAVLAEAMGPGTGAVSPAVVNLAQGVARMATTRLRLVAAVGIAIGLLGSTGTGIYLATAADSPKQSQNQTDNTQDTPVAIAPEKTSQSTATTENTNERDLLQRPLKALRDAFAEGQLTEGIALGELFAAIEKNTDLVVRVDVGAFRRIGIFYGNDFQSTSQFLTHIFQNKAVLPHQAYKLPLREVLLDALAQVFFPQADFSPTITFHLRGSQLVIVPAFEPLVKPGIDPLNPTPPTRPQPGMEDEEPPALITTRVLYEQIYGGVVSVSAHKESLSDILSDLRKQTGANIVLDSRCQPQLQKSALTISLNDVRLYDALRVIADMAELKMVYVGNMYYVTTVENAKNFQPNQAIPTMRPLLPLPQTNRGGAQ
jgi:hypothetical protein